MLRQFIIIHIVGNKERRPHIEGLNKKHRKLTSVADMSVPSSKAVKDPDLQGLLNEMQERVPLLPRKGRYRSR